jgi:hypothetical protein
MCSMKFLLKITLKSDSFQLNRICLYETVFRCEPWPYLALRCNAVGTIGQDKLRGDIYTQKENQYQLCDIVSGVFVALCGSGDKSNDG